MLDYTLRKEGDLWEDQKLQFRCNIVREYGTGDESKREELITSYKGLAQEIALRYTGLGLEDEDLIQSAYEGLIVGVDKCLRNPNYNISMVIQRLINYYVVCAVGRWINYKGINHDYSSKVSGIVEVLRVRRTLLIELGREPTADEISKFVSLGLSTIKSILERKDNYYIKYLDDLTDDEKTFVVDGVGDPTIDLYIENLLEEFMNFSYHFTPKELEYAKYKLNGYENPEIAKLMRVNRSRINTMGRMVALKLKHEEEFYSLTYSADQKRESLEEEKRFTNRRKRDRQNNRYRY